MYLDDYLDKVLGIIRPSTIIAIINNLFKKYFHSSTVIRDEFREHPQSIDATPGQDILLNCRPPRGDPEPKVKWVKDNNDVTPSDRILIEDNNLKILQARQDDVGSYTCVAFNLAGERESHPAQLVLRGDSLFSIFKILINLFSFLKFY